MLTQAKIEETSLPDYGKFVPIRLTNFEARWIPHPDPNVDLAVMPIARILQESIKRKTPVYYRFMTISLIANEVMLKNLNAIEDILMIGYPSGLCDEVNNLPIVRRGITATPPGVKFNGRSEFVVDCACFPGSSGSPVLLYNAGGYLDKDGRTNMGGLRVHLLGILWGGPQYDAVGDLKVMPIPTSDPNLKEVAVSRIPMNLGYCVRAEELMWFDEHFKTRIDAEI